MDKPGSYERTRFLNNQASRRFRLRKRAETETVKAYSVVLQRVNVTLRKREETLRQLRDVLLEAYINSKDSSGLDLAVYCERMRKISEKDPLPDISNHRIIRESREIRTALHSELAQYEGLNAIFYRPMKKGPGFMTTMEDEGWLRLLQLIENYSGEPEQQTSQPVSVIVPPPSSSPVTDLSMSTAKKFVSTNTTTTPKSTVTTIDEIFPRKPIPIDQNYQRKRAYLPTTTTPTVASVSPRISLPPGTSLLRINQTTKEAEPVMLGPTGMKISGQRKSVSPTRDDMKRRRKLASIEADVIPSKVTTEPCGLDMLFPISGSSDPPPTSGHSPPLLEVSRTAAILWNVNVTDSKPRSSEVADLKIKQELEQIIGV